MLRLDVERRDPRTWMPDNADVMRAFNLLNARVSVQGYHWALTLRG